MWLEIPDKPEYKGKNYQFIVSVEPKGTSTGGSKYMRILVKNSQAGDKKKE